MGQYAEDMLEGYACASCGDYFLDEDAGGFPRYCSAACEPDDLRKTRAGGSKAQARTMPCPSCNRKLMGPFALAQHRAAKGH